MTVSIEGTTPGIAVDGTGAVVNVTVTTGSGGGGGGVTDHGLLTGLSDDDHTQYAKKASNLSDLASAATARTNLGLGTAAVAATGDFDAAGTAAGLVDDLSGVSNQATARTNLGLGSAAVEAVSAFATAAQGVDARTPTAHKTSHQDGGTDELALDASQITTGTVATARLGSGTADSTTFLAGDQTYKTPTASETLAATIIDAKGDLIVGTAADTPARLAVGAAGTLPMADAGATSGITWGLVGVGADNIARPYITGNFYGPVRVVTGTASSAGGYVRCIPYIPTRSFTADRILLYSTAASAGAKARLGIYDSDGTNSLPKTLLLDAGEVALDVATGDRLATISYSFTAGRLYWLAENHNGTYTFAHYGAPTSDYSLAPNWGIGGGIGSPAPKVVTAQTQTYGALPSSLTGDNAYYANNSQWPYMMVRGA